MLEIPTSPLLGQKAVILGIANEYSIAYGCARQQDSLSPWTALATRSCGWPAWRHP